MSLDVAILVLEAMSVYLLVLWAHSLRHRVGLAPFYAFLGGITAVMSWVTDAGVQVDCAGVTFMIGSTVFYTSLLLGAFVVYVFDGLRAARIVIVTIVGVSIFMPLVAAILHLQADLIGVVPMPSLRINTASVATTIADLVFLAIAWEFLGTPRLRLRLWLRAFLTLLGVMWLDVILFSAGAFAGTADYFSIMEGTLVSRFIISIFATPFLYIYLRRQSGKAAGGVIEARPVFALLREMEAVREELSSAREQLELRRQLEDTQVLARATLDALPDRIVIVDQDALIVSANREWTNFICQIELLDEGDIVGRSYLELLKSVSKDNVDPSSVEQFIQGVMDVLSGQKDCFTLLYQFADLHFGGRVVSMTIGGVRHAVIIHADETERERIRGRQQLLNDIFYRLNQRGDQEEMLQETVDSIYRYTGLDAVGLRLHDGDDFSYAVTKGYSDAFLEGERFICSYDCDGDNRPALQCLCGAVISGRTDPSLSCFSKNGSFWTNSMSELVKAAPDLKLPGAIRTGCLDEGYESVAMFPLLAGEELVGLLQLCDRRPGFFEEGQLRFFEKLGTAVGVEIQQARTEKALRESEQNLRHVISSIRDGLWDWDMINDRVTCSPQWFQMLGYDPDEFLVSWCKFEALLYPEDVPSVNEAARAYFCGETELYSVRFRMLRKDGSFAWVWARGSLVERTEEGEPARVIGVNIDITETYRVQQALETSEERYRKLFNSMQSGFALHEIICNEQGEPYDYRFLEVNLAFEVQTGLSAESVVGRTAREVFPSTEPHWIEMFGRVALTGEPAHFEEFSVVFDRHYSVSAYSPSKGRFAAIFTDVTEQKKTEKMIIRARDAAEESNRAKTQFLANMSHELRTPLNAIIGLSELLSDSVLDDEQADYIQTIGTSGEALLSIVSDLLDLSKIEMGKVTITRCEFDVRQTVDSSISLLSTFANQKSIRLSSEVGLDVPALIMNDADRVQQVLVNLLNNSLKFTQEGGFVQLGVHLGVTSGGGRCVEFVVEDNGLGMDAETMVRIFEPFQQGDASTTRQHGGVGLGLAICRDLVKMMGGEISVESQLGQGATFRFSVEDYTA